MIIHLDEFIDALSRIEPVYEYKWFEFDYWWYIDPRY